MKHNAALVSLGLMAAVACGGEELPASALTSQDLAGGPFDAPEQTLDRSAAEARAAGFFGGTVISSEVDVERGLAVFEIDVLLPSGAVVEVELEESTGRVVEIEGEVGPFTDALTFGDGFISLADAIAAARELSAAPVVEWELELDDGRIWVFEIELDDGVQLEIDARTGAIVDDDHADDPWDDSYDDGVYAEAPSAIVQKALAIVQGDVVGSERELEHGMAAWQISVRTPTGATADIYLLQHDGGLLRVKDDNGPFGYAVEPGRGWLTLDQAIEAAGGTVETLTQYRLDREYGRLLWELKFDDGEKETEVDIDATSGARVD